ncbi:MAG TPA: calcium-binding protein [Solirubrobacterales bacterium]
MDSPWTHRCGGLAATILCSALVGTLGVTGAGADVNPAGGSNFDTGDDGWQVQAAQCSFADADGGGLCSASGERIADGGNPGGALRARTEVLANTGGLFTSEHVLRSPSFTLENPFDAVFSYDRRLAQSALLSIGVRSDVSVVLVDDASGAERLLTEDPLGNDDREFENRLVGVPAGVLAANGTYHLELRVSTGNDSSQEEVFGTTDVLFDNLRLVSSERGGGSANGPGGSGGDGTAPGGSVTLLRKCTIVGTEGDDRIVGTKRTDIVCALGGDDVVKTKGGPDVIDAANGNDTARGGKKADLLLGLKGKDRLIGSKGADRLLGGKDRDVLKAGADNDNISARDGERDLVDGGPGKRNRARTDGKDKVKRVQRLLGG